jgi:DNA polymerase-4
MDSPVKHGAAPAEGRGGPRRILHLDVDAFLASVEQALHPELRGRPVVVGGAPSSRNLVMSASYEARPFGVRPGISLKEAQRRCPKAVFRDGDSQAANRLREGIARIALDYTPLVEVTSIDDLLLDVTGAERPFGRAFDLAVDLKRRVWAELHLPLTIGIGQNVLFARLAGKLGKPGGVAELWPGQEQSFLDALPLEHLPGIGHSIGAQLARFGLKRVGELRLLAPRELLFQSFGRDGLTIHARAQGLDPRLVEASVEIDEHGQLRHRPPQSIRRDSTFEPEEGRPELIEAMLSWLVERAAQRLRSHGQSCRTLSVRVRYVASGLGDPAGSSVEKRHTRNTPTCATRDLWQAALALYRGLPRRRALVKTIGLTLSNFSPASGWQRELFDELPSGTLEAPQGSSRQDRLRELDRVLDALRDRHGFGRVLLGSSLPLIQTHPLGPDGFKLRTPSLNQ